MSPRISESQQIQSNCNHGVIGGYSFKIYLGDLTKIVQLFCIKRPVLIVSLIGRISLGARLPSELLFGVQSRGVAHRLRTQTEEGKKKEKRHMQKQVAIDSPLAREKTLAHIVRHKDG